MDRTLGAVRKTPFRPRFDTNPALPAFRAFNSALTDVTGDDTNYTVVFANEGFDQNADFDGTSTFTAPITGKYLLTASAIVAGMTAPDDIIMRIITSNDTYVTKYTDGTMPVTTITPTLSILADMDAADTAIVELDNSGDTLSHDIGAGDAHFSGVLIA